MKTKKIKKLKTKKLKNWKKGITGNQQKLRISPQWWAKACLPSSAAYRVRRNWASFQWECAPRRSIPSYFTLFPCSFSLFLTTRVTPCWAAPWLSLLESSHGTCRLKTGTRAPGRRWFMELEPFRKQLGRLPQRAGEKPQCICALVGDRVGLCSSIRGWGICMRKASKKLNKWIRN